MLNVLLSELETFFEIQESKTDEKMICDCALSKTEPRIFDLVTKKTCPTISLKNASLICLIHKSSRGDLGGRGPWKSQKGGRGHLRVGNHCTRGCTAC